jgi:acyl carrier protein
MIYQQIQQILVSLGVPEAEITPDAVLDDDLEIDSTEVVELRGALKVSFSGFMLPEKWYRGKTVSALCRLVEEHEVHGAT